MYLHSIRVDRELLELILKRLPRPKHTIKRLMMLLAEGGRGGG